MRRLLRWLWAFVYGHPSHTPVIWGGRVITISAEQKPEQKPEQRPQGRQ